MAIIRVGIDKEFKTIQTAFHAASSGDTLLIDEGVYEEALYFVNKAVNLIGNTDFPKEGNVVIKPISTSVYGVTTRYEVPLTIEYDESSPDTYMFIEGLKFVSDAHSYESTIIYLKQGNSTDFVPLRLVFNKCILDASMGLKSTGNIIKWLGAAGYPIKELTLSNCEIIWAGDDTIISSECNAIPVKKLIKCILSDYPPLDFFGVGHTSVITTTSSGVINPDNLFDNNTSTYSDFQHSPPGWVQQQFDVPKIINQVRFRQYYAGFGGAGFILEASNTGEFLGEQVELYRNLVAVPGTWRVYYFENDIAYKYIRLYNSSLAASVWRLYSVIFEWAYVHNEDYIMQDNENIFEYGPIYSDYITTIPPTHCFSGIVSTQDVPMETSLKIFRRDNAQVMDTITSNATTGEYYFETSFAGYHNIMCSDASGPPIYNALLKSRCVPKPLSNIYTPVVRTSKEIKTIVVDIADNWGATNYIAIRAIDFLINGIIIRCGPVYGSAYSTTYSSNAYKAEFTFNYALSKLGSAWGNSWLSINGQYTNQRLIFVFNQIHTVDQLRITNGHHSVGNTIYSGAKNINIYISSDAYTDTIYGNPIPGSELVFSGILPIHVDANRHFYYDIFF